MRALRLILLHVAAFGVAAATSTSCNVDFPDTAFRCNPSQSAPCPEGFRCCSDDPAAMRGAEGEGILPRYLHTADTMEFGTPVFSGSNNVLSSTGLCIDNTVNAGLQDLGAQGCPIPCNPSWNPDDVNDVCGPGSICCQTVELGTNDCVLEADCWRPAKGADIFNNGVTGTKFPAGDGDPWAAGTHDTHQDPGGTNCRAFALNDPDITDGCFEVLSVANRRGYCLTKSPTVQVCPLTQPSYLDACEQKNLLEGRDCT